MNIPQELKLSLAIRHFVVFGVEASTHKWTQTLSVPTHDRMCCKKWREIDSNKDLKKIELTYSLEGEFL